MTSQVELGEKTVASCPKNTCHLDLVNRSFPSFQSCSVNVIGIIQVPLTPLATLCVYSSIHPMLELAVTNMIVYLKEYSELYF